jgi:Dipeptide/tripeptide permease
VPLIAPAPTRVAGLITIRLPDSVKTGDSFRVITQQLGGLPRRVLGTFELFIPVSIGDKIRPEEERLLSVLKNIGKSIRLTSRWHPVFQRYLAGTGEKVRGLGGSPEQIEPSATGEPGRATGRRRMRCFVLSLLVVLMAALFVVATATIAEPGGRWAFAGASAGLAAVLVAWACICRMNSCGRLGILAVGTAVGSATIGGLWLLGALTAAALPALAWAAAAAGVLSVLALACFCTRRKTGEVLSMDCCE